MDVATWETSFQMLDSLLDLKDGWNGYSAPAPGRIAVDTARAFLSRLEDADLLPTDVDASAVGGVAVTIRRGDRKCFAEFYNDGTAVLLLADDETEKLAAHELSVTPAAFDEAIFEVRDFVNA